MGYTTSLVFFSIVSLMPTVACLIQVVVETWGLGICVAQSPIL